MFGDHIIFKRNRVGDQQSPTEFKGKTTTDNRQQVKVNIGLGEG